MLTIIGVPAISAQTELTTDMIWQEGTHWLYPWVSMDMDILPFRVTIGEFCFVRSENAKQDEVLLKIKQYNPDGSTIIWNDEYRVEGNKIYGIVTETDTTRTYLLYDFDSWQVGNVVGFEVYEDDDIYKDEETGEPVMKYKEYRREETVTELERITCDPDGKYWAYSYRTDDADKRLRVKGIGRVSDTDGLRWTDFYIPPLCPCGPQEYEHRVMALQIWHPDLGVLYKHPEYDWYMSLTSGIESVEADEAQGEPVITAGGGAVTIATDDVTRVTVCTPTGAVVRQETIAGTVSYPLTPGIYIVRAGAVTRKVRV